MRVSINLGINKSKPIFCKELSINKSIKQKIMYKLLSLIGVVTLTVILTLSFIPADKNIIPETDATTNTQGITFIEADWNKALAEAKKQHKLIFLDAYTSWCGPCKLLKKNTFSDKAAGDFFNTHFVNVAVDMEKGFGPALLEKYGVNAFPTLLIIDENGKKVSFSRGFIPAEVLIEFGKDGLAEK
jgi:thioredoxin 1